MAGRGQRRRDVCVPDGSLYGHNIARGRDETRRIEVPQIVQAQMVDACCAQCLTPSIRTLLARRRMASVPQVVPGEFHRDRYAVRH
jgi:hypothetical protein